MSRSRKERLKTATARLGLSREISPFASILVGDEDSSIVADVSGDILPNFAVDRRQARSIIIHSWLEAARNEEGGRNKRCSQHLPSAREPT